MKLEIPFYNQTTKLNCGPSALRMVLAYFDGDYSLQLLEEKAKIKEGKGVFTIQIAIAAASLGYPADFYSKQVSFNKENLKLEFYQKYADLITQTDIFVEKAKKLGVHVEEKQLSLEEILSKVSVNSLPIILLDWNVVKGTREKGYQGHFVPIVGYDDEKVYIHNHGFTEPTQFLAIDRETFNEARTAKGTDEDVIFIYRKQKINETNYI